MTRAGFNEADWKLFRKKLPDWQERYMEKLINEYRAILDTDEEASTKFWNLEKRIRNDKKDTGVLARDISRSNMDFLIMDLIDERAIGFEDLADFSEDYRERMSFYFESRSQNCSEKFSF